jgi:hypothetical protein
MSIVAVHGPNTFGSKSISSNASGSAYAIASNPANGLVWTFYAKDASQVAANYDWAYTGLTGTPATPIADTKNPTITFSGAGTATVTLTLNGVAQPPITVTAVSGAAPRMEPEEEAQVAQFAEVPDQPPVDEEAARSQPSSAGDGDEDDYAPSGFDPAAHTVAEVEQYVEEHPEEAVRIFQLEEEGKARVTLLTHLESLLDDE